MCYFFSTEERSVPVAPRRTVCNRTPHCRATPQTTCLRSLVEGRGCEKAKAQKKNTRKHKSFLQLKQSKLVHKKARRGGGGVMSPVLLSVTAAHLTSRAGSEECAPTSRVHSSGGETWQRLHSCPAGGGEENSPLTAGVTSGMTEIWTV